MKINVMAVLLFITVTFFVQGTEAQEKIDGAFGIALGQVFNPSIALGEASLTDGTPMYQFSPTKEFRSFSRYFVLITPETNKVYSIWGLGNVENTPTCEKEQKLVMAILSDKYGNEEKQGLLSDLYDMKMITQGDRTIITKCSGFTDITMEIRYKDSQLQELAENERIKLESKKLDSSGL
jgi:hypothetical protein